MLSRARCTNCLSSLSVLWMIAFLWRFTQEKARINDSINNKFIFTVIELLNQFSWKNILIELIDSNISKCIFQFLECPGYKFSRKAPYTWTTTVNESIYSPTLIAPTHPIPSSERSLTSDVTSHLGSKTSTSNFCDGFCGKRLWETFDFSILLKQSF